MNAPDKPLRRWMRAALAESASCKLRMPWERGLRRQAMIARRLATVPVRQTARRIA